ITNASESIGDGDGTINISTGLKKLPTGEANFFSPHERLNPGTYIMLRVTDTGCGITPEQIPRIFDPFYTTKFAGRGLGMAAVMGIVKGHRGTIQVQTTLGVGTAISVYLPAGDCVQRGRNRSTSEESIVIPSDGIILVIDDDEDVRAVIRLMLENRGFAVFEASDGIEGLALFDEYKDEIDVVLLDMTMPKLRGDEVFSALMARSPQTPVVIMSGYSMHENADRFSGKIADYVQKPFNFKQLIKALAKAMAMRPNCEQ
ncbi:response regulator, partial [Myxococcota bacterium]|nr:response regulator [Myxococcota bacterium]